VGEAVAAVAANRAAAGSRVERRIELPSIDLMCDD